MRILGLTSLLMLTTACLALPELGGNDYYWEDAETGWGDWDGYSSWPDSEQGRLVAESEAWGTVTGAGLSPDGSVSHVGMSGIVCGFNTNSGSMGYDVTPSGSGETEVVDTTEDSDGNVIVMARQRGDLKLYTATWSSLSLEERLGLSDVTAAGFSGGDTVVALTDGAQCAVTSLRDGRVLDQVDVDSGACDLGEMSVVPEGAYVATGDDALWVSDGIAQSLDLEAEVVSALESAVYVAGGDTVTALDRSRSQQWQAEVNGTVVDMAAIDELGVAVLVASGNNRDLLLLDAQDGTELDRLEATSLTFGVEVSADGSTLQLTTGTSVAFFSVQ